MRSSAVAGLESARLRVLKLSIARSHSAKLKRKSPRVFRNGKIRRFMSLLIYRGVQLRCLASSALVTQVPGFRCSLEPEGCSGMQTCLAAFLRMTRPLPEPVSGVSE